MHSDRAENRPNESRERPRTLTARRTAERISAQLILAEVNVHFNGRKTQVFLLLHFMHDGTQSPQPRLPLLRCSAAF